MCCCMCNMNVSPYLTILLIIGSQRTAQVWDGRHSSHRNFLPFQCMPPAAACSLIFANASHGQGSGWRLKPTSRWLWSVNPAPCCPYSNLDKWCFFKEVPPKTKWQNKVKLSWRLKLEETLCLSSKSQPIHFETYRLSIFGPLPRDVAMLLLAPNHSVVHGEWMSNIAFGTDVLVRGWPLVFPKSKHIMDPVQFQVRSPLFSNYPCFNLMRTVHWCTLFWTLWCYCRLSEISFDHLSYPR